MPQGRREVERWDIVRRQIEEAETTRRGMLLLTPPALERHLGGQAEELRSGVRGRVREAIRASVEKVLETRTAL